MAESCLKPQSCLLFSVNLSHVHVFFNRISCCCDYICSIKSIYISRTLWRNPKVHVAATLECFCKQRHKWADFPEVSDSSSGCCLPLNSFHLTSLVATLHRGQVNAAKDKPSPAMPSDPWSVGLSCHGRQDVAALYYSGQRLCWNMTLPSTAIVLIPHTLLLWEMRAWGRYFTEWTRSQGLYTYVLLVWPEIKIYFPA